MDKALSQFEDLYQRYGDVIFRHIYFRLGDRERAKELTQEVFMRAWQHIAAQKPISYEKAFLYKIAHNLFINEIRTKKTTMSLDALEEDGFEATDSSLPTAKEAEKKELLLFLQKLPPSYRDVLIYRYIDELAVKEIAALLNEKETNISMRIARGIEKLKDLYNPSVS